MQKADYGLDVQEVVLLSSLEIPVKVRVKENTLRTHSETGAEQGKLGGNWMQNAGRSRDSSSDEEMPIHDEQLTCSYLLCRPCRS